MWIYSMIVSCKMNDVKKELRKNENDIMNQTGIILNSNLLNGKQWFWNINILDMSSVGFAQIYLGGRKEHNTQKKKVQNLSLSQCLFKMVGYTFVPFRYQIGALGKGVPFEKVLPHWQFLYLFFWE